MVPSTNNQEKLDMGVMTSYIPISGEIPSQRYSDSFWI